MTGFVFVSVPPPKGEKYAFSVSVSSLYSILVYPVSPGRNISADVLSLVSVTGTDRLPSSK
jgi:hypothetical protein